MATVALLAAVILVVRPLAYARALAGFRRELNVARALLQKHEQMIHRGQFVSGLDELAACRHLVEAHDGSLDVRSPLGGGCRFHLELPVSAPGVDAVAAAAR